MSLSYPVFYVSGISLYSSSFHLFPENACSSTKNPHTHHSKLQLVMFSSCLTQIKPNKQKKHNQTKKATSKFNNSIKGFVFRTILKYIPFRARIPISFQQHQSLLVQSYPSPQSVSFYNLSTACVISFMPNPA